MIASAPLNNLFVRGLLGFLCFRSTYYNLMSLKWTFIDNYNLLLII